MNAIPLSTPDTVYIVNNLATLQDAGYISLKESQGYFLPQPGQHLPLARDPGSCVPPTLPTAGELNSWGIL